MRKVLLWPGLLMLSVAVLGCGGSGEEDAQAPEGGASTATAPEKGADDASPEVKASTAGTNATENKSASSASASMATGDRVGVDTTYILPEAAMVLVVHPQQLLKSPLLSGNADVKAKIAEATDKFGLSPEDIEQLIISGGPPSGPDGIQKPMSIVAKLSKAHEGKATLDKMAADNPKMGDVEELEYNGVAYFHAKPAPAEDAGDAPAEPSPFGPEPASTDEGYALLPDDKTVVLAEDEDVIKTLIDNKGTVKTELTDAMAKLDASSDVVLLLTMNDQLREMAAGAPAPQTGGALDKLPESLLQGIVRVGLSPDVTTQIVLSLDDQQNAAETDKAIKDLVQQSQASLDQQLQQIKAAPPGGPGAMMAPMFEEFQKVLAGISTQQSGSDVIITINGLGEVDYQSIAGPIMMMMMMSGMGGGAPGGDFGPPNGGFDAPGNDFDLPPESAPADEAPADEDGN